MPGEVGEALTGQRFGDFRKESNVEDRRGEHSMWQNMLMELGIAPVDHTDAAKIGLGPQEYYPGQLDPKYEKPTPLGIQAGYFDATEEPAWQTANRRIEPMTIDDLLKRDEQNGPR
jgi:hypothetical protein